ncbi:MAG: hypothetical protein ACRYE8_01855 [Janthinobacterium lividum]
MSFCHPVACPRDPVKNTNNISIFLFSGLLHSFGNDIKSLLNGSRGQATG